MVSAAQVMGGSYSVCILPKPVGSAIPVCWGNEGNYNGLTSMTWHPVLSTAHGYSYCFADASDNIAECIGNEGTDWDSGFPSGFKIRSA
jgi:hypothetical protein